MRKSFAGVALVCLATTAVPAAASAAGDGYCGHGSTGITRVHKFTSHVYLQPKFDKHDEADYGSGTLWIGYSFCGH